MSVSIFVLNLWRRFLAWIGFGGNLVTMRPRIGLVCHRLDDADVAALATMGIRHVRLSLYAHFEGADVIDRAIRCGYDILVVTYRSAIDRPMDAARWPSVRWQVGNEPHWNIVLPASAVNEGAVSCGLASGTPEWWIGAFALAMPPNQILALHAYGFPLADAVKTTLARIPAGRACWLTEIGCHGDAELLDAIQAIDGAKVERVYIYALWSESDGYTLTSEQQRLLLTLRDTR